MKRIKEKIKAIWYIIKGGQYAVYVLNHGYVSSKVTPNKAACLISDNASKLFVETIIEFNKKYIIEYKLNNEYYGVLGD